ncbi:MAG: ATP-binding protein [Bacteroidota bacterium]
MKTIKGKIMLGLFIVLLGSMLAVLFLSWHFLQKREIASTVSNEIKQMQNLFLKDTKTVSEILRNEKVNVDFFVNDSTVLVQEHNRFINSILLINKNQNFDSYTDRIGLSLQLDTLYTSLLEYRKIVNQILLLIKERGYKDYGVEGRMRQSIHKLELFREINKVDILSLRRHEKDYIIRHESIYVDKLNTLSQNIRNNILNRVSKPDLRDSALVLLDDYTSNFNYLVNLDNQIGVDKNFGLKAKLDNITNQIDIQFNKLVNYAEVARDSEYKKLHWEYITFFFILLASSIFIGLLIAHSTIKPLAVFVDHINNYVESNFTKLNKINRKGIPSEIMALYKSFNNMVEQLQNREEARLKAEATIIHNELRYRELAELLPVGIFETDSFGNFIFVNRAWVKSVGYSKKDINKRINFSQIILNQDFEKLFKGYKTNQVECNVIRKDGSTFNAVLITNEVKQNSERRGIRGIIIDNTERRKIIDALKQEKLKAQQSDKLKTAFLANMSHEIRTPMNAIIGFSNLLEQHTDTLPDQLSEYISIIKKSGEHLLQLIDDIIDIASIESGVLQIKPSACNPYLIGKEVYDMFAAKLHTDKNKNLEIRYNANLPHDILIHSDSLRLRQVLVNLIGNAIKFTEKGHVELTINLKELSFVEFKVTDTGIGIDPQNHKKIFEPFKQADDDVSPTYGGNGLGLAISKKLVEHLGGSIWVESTRGKGSCFFFTIPYNPVSDIVRAPETDSFNNKIWIKNDKNYTILIAEDEDSNFIYLRDFLTLKGLRIIRAKNGFEAVNICSSNSIDLVFMDIHMPKMNGYEATRRIKEKYPNIPVVAQTAYALPLEREKCLEAGCIDYLSKPISLEKLVDIIERLLMNRDSQSHKDKTLQPIPKTN